MNPYEKALKKIKKDEKYKPKCSVFINEIGITGPTGPQGLPGIGTLIVGSYDNELELEKAHPIGEISTAYIVGDDLYVWSEENNAWKDIGRIRGSKGDKGDRGPQGEQGPKGDPGPRGTDGTSVTILGNFPSLEELEKHHKIGSAGDSYLVGSYLYVWSIETNSWINVGEIRGPKGDLGPTGPKGDPGPLKIPTIIVMSTMPDIGSTMKEIQPKDNLPLTVKINDNNNNIYLNSTNNTIVIYEQGVYQIEYIVQVRPAIFSDVMQNSNIISIGFKKVGEPVVYAGTSVWATSTTPMLITGHGIINLTTPKGWFCLANIGKSTFYIQNPSIEGINSEYSFVSPVVSISIQKIG